MTPREETMPEFISSRHRANYLAALNILSGMGVALQSLAIRAVGIYENYRGEIRSQHPAPGEPVGPGTAIRLEIGVSSIVDRLPYQFFYGLRGERDSDRSWEDTARSLLAPFDAAVIRYRARMRACELRYRFGMADREYLARFMELFAFRSDEQAAGFESMMLWASILPSLHEWGGNPKVVARVLNLMFGYRFRIVEHARARAKIPPHLHYRLGSKTGRLGKETLLGESFEECDSTYEVVVCDLPAAEVSGFLPGGHMRRRIETLLDYCMPGELEYRIVVKVARGETAPAGKMYLGYSSFVAPSQRIT